MDLLQAEPFCAEARSDTDEAIKIDAGFGYADGAVRANSARVVITWSYSPFGDGFV